MARRPIITQISQRPGSHRDEQQHMSSYAHYINTAWPSSLDSLEGVPDIFEPRVKLDYARAPVRRSAHDVLDWFGGVLPGVGLALALAWAGYMLSEAIGQKLHFDKGKSP